MIKVWCIKYTERNWFWESVHFMEIDGCRVDTVLKDFHRLKPKAVINEIYIEYRKR